RKSWCRLPFRRGARPRAYNGGGGEAVKPPRLSDGDLAHHERVGASECRAFCRGDGLREAGDRVQSELSRYTRRAGRVRGSSRTQSGCKGRSRRLRASVARIDLERSAADPAVPPFGGSRALPLRSAQGGTARLIRVTASALSFGLAGCPDVAHR